MKHAGVLGLVLVLAAVQAAGEPRIMVNGSLEWERMEISAVLALDAASAGVQLPMGRVQAEEILSHEFPGLLSPHILAIPVDSSSTIEDMVREGKFPRGNVGDLMRGAHKTPPAFSGDFSLLSASYRIDITSISSLLIRHSRATELRQPLQPVPAAGYTGIIIIADGELPIHGKRSGALVQPCLFPKIWDTEMNLIYERNTLDPALQERHFLVQYVSQESVFQNSPSGLSPTLLERVGSKPLRILARGVFGTLPTDPIIDRDDALLILSSAENRRLLREGRIALVLHSGVLRNTF